MLFKSDLTLIKDLRTDLNNKDVPQLYRADIPFAYDKGNSNFKSFLNEIVPLFSGDGFKYTSIDSRTHMLMKGMYPCIPGWHCDDFYRPTNNQPDLLNVEKEAPQKHYILVLGDCSLTEFLSDDITLPKPDDFDKKNPSYFYYDQIIEEGVSPPGIFIEPNKIYSFGPLAFHRGSPASENGWRTFIRITRSNHYEPKNELRYQTNVYLTGRTSW